MTFETKAVMRSSCFIGLVVVLAGITAGAAPATSTTRTAMPGKNGRIVFVDGVESGNLVLVNADGTGRVRLTFGPDGEPAFSPNGKLIAFTSLRRGDRDIYTLAPDASNLRQITFSNADDRDPTWSPDGARLAFETTRNGGQTDIYSVGADGAGSVKLAGTPANELDPAWSPKGDEDRVHGRGRRPAADLGHGRQRQPEDPAHARPEFQREPELVARRAADRLRFRQSRAGQPRHLLDEPGRLNREAAHRQPGPRRGSRLLAEWCPDRLLERSFRQGHAPAVRDDELRREPNAADQRYQAEAADVGRLAAGSRRQGSVHDSRHDQGRSARRDGEGRRHLRSRRR